jgi:hypothetical protein
MALPKENRRLTRLLRNQPPADLVESLAVLLPAGRHYVVDSRGDACYFDVFVTYERRGGKKVACAIRVVSGQGEFALDDGSDEFAHAKLAGAPGRDADGNVQISAVRRSVDGSRRGSSLWLAHDLSAIAVEDEIFYV